MLSAYRNPRSSGLMCACSIGRNCPFRYTVLISTASPDPPAVHDFLAAYDVVLVEQRRGEARVIGQDAHLAADPEAAFDVGGGCARDDSVLLRHGRKVDKRLER